MLCSFAEVLDRAIKCGQKVVSVAAAQDKEVLEAIKAARDIGLADAILVGDETLIRALLPEVGLPSDMRIVHEPDAKQAALKAVSFVRKGEAQVFVKGLMNSGVFLKAALNAEVGLRTGRQLSHLAAFEVPNGKKVIFFADTGITILPTLEEKIDILTNSLIALKALGIEHPKVAILTANEMVNPKMPATVDAKALVDLQATGQYFQGCTMEGPISADVAFDPEAAVRKGLTSQIAGDVDLFIFPSVEAGNICSKALSHFANFKFSGVVIGATRPSVLVSRADSAETKLNSIALACLIAGCEK
jgi:phosphate butyryltransferase